MKRILVKEEACIGCHLCEVYCQVAHSASQDLLKAFQKEAPPRRSCIEESRPVCFSVRCQHCADPACVSACLTGALQRDAETGIVTVDEARCVGCWTCILACPFGAIRQDKSQGRIAKCDLCIGQAAPACVANCPNEALVYAAAPDDGLGAGR